MQILHNKEPVKINSLKLRRHDVNVSFNFFVDVPLSRSALFVRWSYSVPTTHSTCIHALHSLVAGCDTVLVFFRYSWQRVELCWLLAGRYEVVYDHVRHGGCYLNIPLLGLFNYILHSC